MAIVRLLAQRGADTQATTNAGSTAIFNRELQKLIAGIAFEGMHMRLQAWSLECEEVKAELAHVRRENEQLKSERGETPVVAPPAAHGPAPMLSSEVRVREPSLELRREALAVPPDVPAPAAEVGVAPGADEESGQWVGNVCAVGTQAAG